MTITLSLKNGAIFCAPDASQERNSQIETVENLQPHQLAGLQIASKIVSPWQTLTAKGKG